MRPTLPRLRWKTIAIIGLVLTVLIPLQIYLWAHSTLPQQRGNITLDELTDDVEIVRDNYGVPHIFAPDWRNAYVALGYIHGQDRLWQMELMRRAGAGRLSEILGNATVKTDKLMRTLGIYAAARDSYYALSPDVQTALQAYAAGVNAFIAHDELPMEMRLLHMKPEPWQPADSLVWMKLMAYQLGGQWRDEIDAARLMTHVDEDEAGLLLGWDAIAKTEPSPKPIPAIETTDSAETVDNNPIKKNNPSKTPSKKKVQKRAYINWQKLASTLPPHGPRSASNGWVVGGRFTADGMPQLANDPHLALGTPILWYLARIVTPEGSVTGATAPGMPFHVLGQNDDMAWGITSTMADTTDLYIEHLKSPEQYITPNGAEAFTTRTEDIKVKGEKRILLPVRITRHGVVISDIDQQQNITDDSNVVALGATFLRGDDTGAEALYWLNRAKTPSDIEQAARYVQAPVQNLFFADRRGNFGMRVVGSVPVRAKTTGVIPADGTKIDGDWIGVIPRVDLPRFTNPIQGYVGNANEKMVNENYPYVITRQWAQPWRGERLNALLQHAVAGGSVTSVTHIAIQNDIISTGALRLRNAVLALIPAPASGTEKQAYLLLKSWQGDYSLKASAPLVLAYLEQALLPALLGDELGDDITALKPIKISLLLRVLSDTERNWCDNLKTESEETCATTVTAAWKTAIHNLVATHGSNSNNWEWLKVNIAPLENKFWEQIPVIGGWVNNAIPVDGGGTTLKRADNENPDAINPFTVTHAAGYRAIYSANNPDIAHYVTATGQSASIASPDYANLTPLWAAGKYIKLKGSLGELQDKYDRYLTLESATKKR